jgi:hypothetical protein
MTKEKAPSFHGMIESMEREAFEAFVSSPPFEYRIERMTEMSAWPGNYRSLAVQLAWEAWKVATKAEREACAMVCDDRSKRKNDGSYNDYIWELVCSTNELAADAIRARGDK